MAEEGASRPPSPRCEQCGQPLVLGVCGMCRPAKPVAPAAPVTAAATADAPTAAPTITALRTTATTSSAPTAPTAPTDQEESPPATAPAPVAAGGQQPVTVVLLALVAVLVLATGYLVVTVSGLKTKVNDLEAEAQNQKAQIQTVGGQIKVIDDAEKQVSNQLDEQAAADPTALATKVQPAVWTIATQSVLGSGWVVKSDAGSSTFITNYHVIADAVADGTNAVKVFQDEGAQLDGVIGAYDEAADLAVVSVPGQLPSLTLSNVTPLPGAPVLVIGSPLGLGGSVTTGSISAIRNIEGINYIQFSAPISPGNSGGPLVNGAGKVIGVTVAKVVGGGAEGIGLAIPVSQVCDRLKFCP